MCRGHPNHACSGLASGVPDHAHKGVVRVTWERFKNEGHAHGRPFFPFFIDLLYLSPSLLAG